MTTGRGSLLTKRNLNGQISATHTVTTNKIADPRAFPWIRFSNTLTSQKQNLHTKGSWSRAGDDQAVSLRNAERRIGERQGRPAAGMARSLRESGRNPRLSATAFPSGKENPASFLDLNLSALYKRLLSQYPLTECGTSVRHLKKPFFLFARDAVNYRDLRKRQAK